MLLGVACGCSSCLHLCCADLADKPAEVTLTGDCPKFVPNSRMFDFKRNGWIHPNESMAMLGWDKGDLEFVGDMQMLTGPSVYTKWGGWGSARQAALSRSQVQPAADVRSIQWRCSATTALLYALTPICHYLGFLQELPG